MTTNVRFFLSHYEIQKQNIQTKSDSFQREFQCYKKPRRLAPPFALHGVTSTYITRVEGLYHIESKRRRVINAIIPFFLIQSKYSQSNFFSFSFFLCVFSFCHINSFGFQVIITLWTFSFGFFYSTNNWFSTKMYEKKCTAVCINTCSGRKISDARLSLFIYLYYYIR